MQLFVLLATLAVVSPTSGQFHEFTQNGLQVQCLALEGEPAPGMAAGVRLTSVGTASALGAYGGTAFNAEVAGPGITPGVNDVILYSLQGNSLVPVARIGDPAPGLTPPHTFNGFFLAQAVNGHGDVVFDPVHLEPPGTAGTWIYRDGLEPVATLGQPAPGTGGLVFKTSALYAQLSESRHVAFLGGTGLPDDTSKSWGVWTDRTGTLTKVYDAQDPAPAPLSNLRLGAAWLKTITLDDRLVFTTTLSGPGVTWRNDDAVFAERNGQLKLIAREGDPAPDTQTGVVFIPYSLDTLRATADGRVSIRGGLSGPGVTADNDIGIWSEASGELRLINRKGDPAPAAGAGLSFGGAESVAPAFNNKGQTVFKSALRGPGALGVGTESIWLDDNGTKTLLARLGDHAPGFGPDTHYTSFQDYTLGINNLGDIVLEGQVYGPDARRFPLALWFIHDGQPQLFMQQDGYFDGQLVSGFGATEPNNLGQVRIYVVFAGPDGIQETADDLSAFYLVTIPEPATLALFALGAGLIGLHRRTGRGG